MGGNADVEKAHLNLNIPAAPHIQAALVGLRGSRDLPGDCKPAKDGSLPSSRNGLLCTREHDSDGADSRVHMQHLHLHTSTALFKSLEKGDQSAWLMAAGYERQRKLGNARVLKSPRHPFVAMMTVKVEIP